MTKRKNAVSYENAQVWQTHGITLREKFPEYRTAQEVRREIAAVPQLEEEFLRLKPQYQEDFLNICCGNQGVKILYDSFFKKNRQGFSVIQLPRGIAPFLSTSENKCLQNTCLA